jgi:thymidine kinase
MFSGKTTRLIELFSDSQVETNERIAIKPLMDNRYGGKHLQAHTGLQLPGHRISKPEEIYPLVNEKTIEIYIDEIQFFGEIIYQVILDLCLQGKKIIAAGLDKDFQGNDFGAMPKLMQLANTRIPLHAKCVVCGKSAGFTFRKAEGDAVILVGHSDMYEARCEEHWQQGMQQKIK